MPTATAVVSWGGGFVVAPITTELQRLGKSRADADAWVLVRLRDDLPLNVDLLRENLAAWPRTGAGKVYVYVVCVTEPGQQWSMGTDWSEREPVIWRHEKLIRYALRGAAREAGFAEAVVEHVGGSDSSKNDWNGEFADFEANAAGDAVAEEPGIGDDMVKVYPVRTVLSHIDHMGADCVIRIVPPLDAISMDSVPAMHELMSRCVEQLRLPRRQRVTFLVTAFTSPQGGVDEVEDEKRGKLLNDISGRLWRNEQVWKGLLKFEEWTANWAEFAS